MSATLRHPATPSGLLLLLPDICLLRAMQRRIEMEQAETAPQSRSKSLLAGWISRQDLARELGLSIDTLGRWQRKRKGPACIKAGRKVFYRRSVVESWLLAQVQPCTTKKAGGRK
jgi:Helix-turn-helix domain